MTYHIPEDEIRQAVLNSKTISETLRRLGLTVGGGSHHKRFEKRLLTLEIDFSHFTPGWQRGSPNRPGFRTIKEILVRNSTYTSMTTLKRRLTQEGLLAEICGSCSLGPIWNQEPLTLQIDHINGDSRDHRLENLRLLCPNCHSQTKTFAGRNKRRVPSIALPNKDACPDCGKPKTRRSPRCFSCTTKVREKADWPTDQELRFLVWSKPVTQVAADLGVSSPAVKKRCRGRGITTPPRGYWQKKRAAARKQG